MERGRAETEEVEDDHGDEKDQTHLVKSEEEETEAISPQYPVPELPPEIVVDILSRLPVNSVFICRRVCKLWLSLISGSDFSNLHLSRSQDKAGDTEEYKVLRYFYSSDNESLDNFEADLEIYTLGEEGSWRSIGKSPHIIRNGPFLNGSIHWRADASWNPNSICCFDFASEQLGAVPEPSEFTLLQKEYPDRMSIGVLQNCLSICNFKESNHADIWLMKDYGVKDTWSKYLVIQTAVMSGTVHLEHGPDSYEPIMIFESGNVLLLINSEGLFLYDPDTKDYSYVDISGIPQHFVAIAHIQSFISLRHVAKGEDV